MTEEKREARVRCGKHWLTSHKFVHHAHPHSSNTKRPKALKAHRVCTALTRSTDPTAQIPTGSTTPQLRRVHSRHHSGHHSTSHSAARRHSTHWRSARAQSRVNCANSVCVDAYLGERDAGGRYPPHELPRRQGVERHLLQVVVHGYSRTPLELARAPRPSVRQDSKAMLKWVLVAQRGLE